MKTVLITGVAGFIGSNLANRLLREGGYRVLGIDNLSAGPKEQIPEGVEFYEEDIRSRNMEPLFQGVDAVFHLAAKNCISDCQKDPATTADINITGTLRVLEAAKKARVKKVIYAESSAVYEGSTLLPTPETEMAPQSFYALSKAAGRMFAQGYDMDMTALRYFCVYGPRQDYRRTIPPVMSAFILQLLQKKQPVIYGDGKKRRDFVYIEDINDFHLLCLTNEETSGKVFNLGSGKNHSVNEIFALISRLLKTNAKPLYKDSLPGEALETLASIEAAKQIGWRPKTSLEEGLLAQIRYIKEQVLS